MRALAVIIFSLVLQMVGCNPAFATSPETSAIWAEREALASMALIMADFEAAYAGYSEEMQELRSDFERGRFDRARTQAEAAEHRLTLARRQWNRLGRTYRRVDENSLNLGRQIHNEILDKNPGLQAYVKMQRNNRFDHGSPLSLLFRSWLGLSVGKKIDETPTRLRDTQDIEGLEIHRGDDLYIHLTSGGTIRGTVEGWNRNGDLLLREVLPIALMLYQKRLGNFRKLTDVDWQQVASVEIHRLAYIPPRGLSHVPFLDRFGNYSTLLNSDMFDHSTRLVLKPSDAEILKAAKGRESKFMALRQKTPALKTIDPERQVRPIYSEVLLFDCESELGL